MFAIMNYLLDSQVCEFGFKSIKTLGFFIVVVLFLMKVEKVKQGFLLLVEVGDEMSGRISLLFLVDVDVTGFL